MSSSVWFDGHQKWGGFDKLGGFVAQISVRPELSLPLTNLSYGLCLGYAKRCEAGEYRSTDLDLGDLPLEVSRSQALIEKFHTMHFCLKAVPAVVSG
tara:strand:+ start:5316 stop:5606 length:291 start_codon:yes stop_codon:yes gene_type:complete